MSDIWKIGDVLEYVEHPERRVRVREPASPENQPFKQVNQLGAMLNKFDRERQYELIYNFIDTLDQL